MTKNKIYLILVISLIALAIFFWFKQKSGTLPGELMDFAVSDTASVSQIFMADKSGKKILLKRKEGYWEVNDKYPARKDAIDILLKTLHRMEVKSPVSKASFDNVVKNLAADHTKVEVYLNESKPIKIIYIGGPTADNYGTYMMLEKSTTPFVVHIPGFSGYLSTRFFLGESEWRDISLFRYEFSDLRSVRINHNLKPQASFEITSNGNNQFELFRGPASEEVKQFDTLKVKQYLAGYKKLSFERFITELDAQKVDSIIASPFIFEMIVSDKDNRSTRLRTFLRPAKEPTEEMPWDADRMYGQINDSKDLVIVQYFNFDPLFLEYTDFLIAK